MTFTKRPAFENRKTQTTKSIAIFRLSSHFGVFSYAQPHFDIWNVGTSPETKASLLRMKSHPAFEIRRTQLRSSSSSPHASYLVSALLAMDRSITEG